MNAPRLLLSGFLTSTFMTLTDYMILFFSCHGLKIYGEWLHKHHRVDLWIFRILVRTKENHNIQLNSATFSAQERVFIYIYNGTGIKGEAFGLQTVSGCEKLVKQSINSAMQGAVCTEGAAEM